MSICNEVERNFEDYAFLKKYGINSSDVDFDIGDGDLDSKFNLNLKYGWKYQSIGGGVNLGSLNNQNQIFKNWIIFQHIVCFFTPDNMFDRFSAQ